MSGTPVVLANTLDRGGSAGYVALLIVLLLGLATYGLYRNLNARLKRLPTTFEQQPPEQRHDPDQTP